MNCPECQAWLQERLDGEETPISEELELHWTLCATCRAQYHVALLLLEGLKQMPSPLPNAGFAQKITAKVLHDRQHRRAKMRRHVLVTVALAASVLLMLLAGYSFYPRQQPVGPSQPPSLVTLPSPEKEPTPKNSPQPPAPVKKAEPRNTLASLTDRWVDATRDHAKVVLVATNLDTMEKLPVMSELPPLDPGVREAGQEVSDGVRAVTRNARRAFDFFTRELPMPDMETQRN